MAWTVCYSTTRLDGDVETAVASYSNAVATPTKIQHLLCAVVDLTFEYPHG